MRAPEGPLSGTKRRPTLPERRCTRTWTAGLAAPGDRPPDPQSHAVGEPAGRQRHGAEARWSTRWTTAPLDRRSRSRSTVRATGPCAPRRPPRGRRCCAPAPCCRRRTRRTPGAAVVPRPATRGRDRGHRGGRGRRAAGPEVRRPPRPRARSRGRSGWRGARRRSSCRRAPGCPAPSGRAAGRGDAAGRRRGTGVCRRRSSAYCSSHPRRRRLEQPGVLAGVVGVLDRVEVLVGRRHAQVVVGGVRGEHRLGEVVVEDAVAVGDPLAAGGAVVGRAVAVRPWSPRLAR